MMEDLPNEVIIKVSSYQIFGVDPNFRGHEGTSKRRCSRYGTCRWPQRMRARHSPYAKVQPFHPPQTPPDECPFGH